MKTEKFADREEWLAARPGRITGTRAGSLLSKRDKKPLKAFYELIAERVAIPHDGENVMDRGLRLEDEAIERFKTETGKKVNTDLVICSRDEESNISYSPDGLIGKTEDVEVKCLNSAAHIEAFLTKEIPAEYEGQIIQGFVVNDKLKTRYMVFYDPRMPRDFFYLTIKRPDLQDKITEYLEMEREVLRQAVEIEKLLTF
jgi:predicted phage-related endonuclease